MLRNVSIDIAKGIGIILVVLGHLSSPVYSEVWLDCVRDFAYQFHLPLFFFLSGIFVNTQEKWPVFLRKKIIRLYVPYIISNVVFLLVHLAACKLNGDSVVLTDNLKHMLKVAFGLAATPLGGPTWFLFVLFSSLILFKTAYQVLHPSGDSILLMVCFFAVLAGIFFNSDFCVSKSLVALFFVCLGYMCSHGSQRCVIEELRPYSPVFFIVSAVALIMCMKINDIDMARGQYGHPFLFILSSLSGITMTCIVSSWLRRFRIAAKCLSFIGMSTMWILVLHFPAFSMVNLIQTAHYSDPKEYMFLLPCVHISGLWPLVYLVAGIALPLMCKLLFGKIRNA